MIIMVVSSVIIAAICSFFIMLSDGSGTRWLTHAIISCLVLYGFNIIVGVGLILYVLFKRKTKQYLWVIFYFVFVFLFLYLIHYFPVLETMGKQIFRIKALKALKYEGL